MNDDRTDVEVEDQRLDQPEDPEPREIPDSEVAQFFHDNADIERLDLTATIGVPTHGGWVRTGVRMTVDGEAVVPTADDVLNLIEAALLGKDVEYAITFLREKIRKVIWEREESDA